jgi:hypothetical protein
MFRTFLRKADGAMTSFGLLLAITMVIVGGIAVDVSHAMMVRTHLQVAADSAAHAALIVRETNTDENVAKAQAIQVANAALPPQYFGPTIQADDIQFGIWDPVAQVFTISPGSDDAVMVNMQRLASRQNSVGTYFLRFIGLNNMDVVRQSVFETYIPTCMREGYVAEDRIDLQSGNLYTQGFCIHSNSWVEVNSGNTFQNNVIVSMPDKRSLVLPASGFTSNAGLQNTLRDGAYQLRILQRIDDIIAGIQSPTSPHYRSYITSPTPVTINRNQKIDTQWQEGRIHILDCTNPNQQATTNSNSTLRRGILITDCQLHFSSGIAFEDAVIASTNATANSVDAAGDFRLGKVDNCANGGDAQLLTYGSVKFAANVEFHNGQVIAAQDITFTSNAGTIKGVSLIAGGKIDGTSNSTIGFCNGAGMANNFYAWYFRLAA